MTFAKPFMITFTGVGDATPIDALHYLSQHYPVEFGILFSKSEQGKGRFPSLDTIEKITNSTSTLNHLRLSAHLCGAHSRAIMTGTDPEIPDEILRHRAFRRVQVNHANPDPGAALSFRLRRLTRHQTCILQARGDEFPGWEPNLNWLYDRSGGTGQAPATWPRHPGFAVGYAGGINPDNVVDALKAIDAPADKSFWIDMESGVRSKTKSPDGTEVADRFDIDLCEKVCKLVFD